MKLIIGLGNPGKQYEKTRHNIGFIILDTLHATWKKEGISDWAMDKKFNAMISGGTINSEKIILLKPQTFMNDSGVSVRAVCDFYKLTEADILVVHDEKDILLGDNRLQVNRSAAGHNGNKSIITHLNTQNFARLRVGVGHKNPNKMKDTADFVLGKFGFFERGAVEKGVADAVEQIQHWVNKRETN